MSEEATKALTFFLALLIVGVYIYVALAMGIQNTWPALIIPAIAFPMVFFFYFYLNQNSIPPLKAPLILHCPRCGIELTTDAEYCPQCGTTLPPHNQLSK